MKTVNNVEQALQFNATSLRNHAAKSSNDGKELGKQDFLNLLMTQMSNQNPLDPMDSEGMMQQLAALGTVEQLQNLNSLTAKMMEVQLQIARATAGSLLGKDVEVGAREIPLNNGDTIPVTYKLDGSADRVMLLVRDSTGEMIREINLESRAEGPHEFAWDGRDNDGNGFVDDYAGWDFYNGDQYPMDDHGHGTHVAGLAAGTFGGVAPKAKVLPVKVLNSQGRGDLATIAAGILYAIDMGVDIINLSLGGPGAGQANADIQALLGSVISAKENNVLLVAAAGNGGVDGLGDCNDANPVYPASFDQENIISVASVDRYNYLTSYSNFGSESVHVAAPGGDSYFGGLLSLGVPSCYGPCPDSEQTYANMSGTSMAAPVVAGIAALVKSVNRNLNYKDIKKILMEQGDFEESLRDKVKSSKVVNALMAVREATN